MPNVHSETAMYTSSLLNANTDKPQYTTPPTDQYRAVQNPALRTAGQLGCPCFVTGLGREVGPASQFSPSMKSKVESVLSELLPTPYILI